MQRFLGLITLQLLGACAADPSPPASVVTSDVTDSQSCFIHSCYPLDGDAAQNTCAHDCNGYCPDYSTYDYATCCLCAIGSPPDADHGGQAWCNRHCDLDAGLPNYAITCMPGSPT